jgi:hypothetical protein
MRSRRLPLALALLLGAALLPAALLPAAEAHAQATAPQPPSWRLDIDLFTPGAGIATLLGYQDGGSFATPTDLNVGLISGQVGARLAFADGNGAYFDFSVSATSDTWLLGEAGYLYRLRLVGDDVEGLALDLAGGLSFGGSTGGTLYFEGRFGPHVGASIDWRSGNFVLGFMVRSRVLFLGPATELVNTAILRVTFGFWG